MKKFIIFGDLNKKYLLPFGLSFFQILLKVISDIFPKEGINVVLEMYSTSFGELSVRLIPLILKINHSQKNNEKNTQKRKCFHYSLFVIVFISTVVMKMITKLAKSGPNEVSSSYNPIADYEFLKLGIEMIFLILISKILLKYKYYIHHVIAIASFIFFGIMCDLVVDLYENMINYGYINIIDFFAIIIDSLYFCYMKYLMEKVEIHYWNIGLTMGLTLTVFSTILLIYVLADKDKSLSDAMISTFYKSLQEANLGLVFLKLFLIIIMNFFLVSLSLLTTFNFEPSFALISYEFSKFYQVLKKYPEKAYCIVFFILQFFCLMILLEIIELNFCDLNINTKRGIEKRGIDDLMIDSGRDSSAGLNKVDINHDYYIHTSDGNQNVEQTEMSIKFNQ